ncbi:NADH-quinone oxidoreductase subunit J [Maritimibacter sp. HL-12]|jgi:NADH-quinone oxidoreductase subunit J|uniref:NADH-quinone oxidoreductase subunit J n=1 Tax=Maritimibacter sp. HL-12 TaxID=1162418 RepID=UPI000A0F390D|nr:NADH-quinone oxidoreductase subunit J [Maritimibacter sp. HL-12]SMH29350.1 NADH dehydrogenase subunit J [Maritimibacter sp. HL-12]
MTVAGFAFYVFALTVLVGGLFTVVSRNPVHAVLWLITAFIGATGLFVLLGAEFLAMLLMIVYVGAVAVLFLFVVMMLDVDFAELKAGMAKYLPIGLLIGVVLLVELGLIFGTWATAEGVEMMAAPAVGEVENTAALGMVIYTDYLLLFQLAGLILLVAMIGAIVLTMRHRRDIKRQNVVDQMHRDPKAAIKMVDVKPGQGL